MILLMVYLQVSEISALESLSSPSGSSSTGGILMLRRQFHVESVVGGIVATADGGELQVQAPLLPQLLNGVRLNVGHVQHKGHHIVQHVAVELAGQLVVHGALQERAIGRCDTGRC